MLAKLQFPNFHLRYVLSLIFLLKAGTGLVADEECNECTQYQVRAANQYIDYYNEYFRSINENTNMDEVIDTLIFLRQSILNQGLECPTIREMCINMVQYVHGAGVRAEDAMLKEFIQAVDAREGELKAQYGRPQVHLSHKKKDRKDKHHRHEKEAKLNSKTVCGFVAALAGGLMSIVPIPGVQQAGIGLTVWGISEIITGVREQSDENQRLQKIDEQRRREEEMLKEPVFP